MKIAITSDYHANIIATKAVYAEIAKSDIDAIIVAGDLIGYYFSPREVVSCIRKSTIPTFVIKGNHEEILISCLSNMSFRTRVLEKYGPGIEFAINQLSANEIEWIMNLCHPSMVIIDGCRILLSHGSPYDINKYFYPDTDLSALEVMKNCCDVIVMGHTHYPFTREVGSSLIINPGSVGQPRNRQPGAHWSILNTSTKKVIHRITPYDLTELVIQCRMLAPNHPYLHQVLTRK